MYLILSHERTMKKETVTNSHFCQVRVPNTLKNMGIGPEWGKVTVTAGVFSLQHPSIVDSIAMQSTIVHLYFLTLILCLYFLHSTLPGRTFPDFLVFLLHFYVQVNLGVNCRSILIGANGPVSRFHDSHSS